MLQFDALDSPQQLLHFALDEVDEPREQVRHVLDLVDFVHNLHFVRFFEVLQVQVQNFHRNKRLLLLKQPRQRLQVDLFLFELALQDVPLADRLRHRLQRMLLLELQPVQARLESPTPGRKGLFQSLIFTFDGPDLIHFVSLHSWTLSLVLESRNRGQPRTRTLFGPGPDHFGRVIFQPDFGVGLVVEHEVLAGVVDVRRGDAAQVVDVVLNLHHFLLDRLLLVSVGRCHFLEVSQFDHAQSEPDVQVVVADDQLFELLDLFLLVRAWRSGLLCPECRALCSSPNWSVCSRVERSSQMA